MINENIDIEFNKILLKIPEEFYQKWVDKQENIELFKELDLDITMRNNKMDKKRIYIQGSVKWFKELDLDELKKAVKEDLENLTQEEFNKWLYDEFEIKQQNN